jgi:hypothetical protein
MGVKINHNRLRPKPSSKNKSKITQSDKDYLEWFSLQIQPCFCCGTYADIQGHHIKNNSCDSKVHTEMLPLCIECHTLSPKLSAHGNSVAFKEAFPIKVQRDFSSDIYNRYLREITC